MQHKNQTKKTAHFAVAEGLVKIGTMSLQCAVLNDKKETRVIDIQSLEENIGIRIDEIEVKTVGRDQYSWQLVFSGSSGTVPTVTSPKFPFILVTLKDGKQIRGISADQFSLLVKNLHGAVEKRSLSILDPKAETKAKKLINGLIGKSIDDLITDQLKYREKILMRLEAVIEAVFEAVLEKKPHPWEKVFPLRFYELIFILWDKEDEWKGLISSSKPNCKPQTQSWVGRLTNDLIYSRLYPPGLLDMLEGINPKDSSNNRAVRHHQHLTYSEGLQPLKCLIDSVISLMGAFAVKNDKDGFLAGMDKRFPKTIGQLGLDFGEKKFISGSEIHDEIHPSLFMK